MKIIVIAALAAAHLAAAGPAQAAGQPREDRGTEQARHADGAEPAVADGHSAAVARTESAREDEPRKKKRKSTGDKVLTGAAVVLGVGALAVGGLLVAIFVN